MNALLLRPLPRPVRARNPHRGVCPDCATTPRVERESVAAFEADQAMPTTATRAECERLFDDWLRRLKCSRSHVMATDPFCDALPEEIL